MVPFASARDLKLEYSLRDTDGDVVFQTLSIPTIAPTFTIFGPSLVNANVIWTNPNGVTTNARSPAVNFFSTIGTYRIHCSDWSRVTYFELGTGNSYISNFVSNVNSMMCRFSGVTNTIYSFYGQPLLRLDLNGFPWETLSNCVSMQAMFYNGNNITGPFPTSLGIFPKVTEQGFSSMFSGCYSLTGNLPNLVGVDINITSLGGTFSTCSNATGGIPDYSGLTNLTSLASYVPYCTNLTGSIPVLSNLVKLTSLAAAFNYCRNITGSYPDISMLTNLTDLGYAFATTKMTGNIPVLSNLVKVTSMDSTFYNNEGGSNSGLVGSIPNLITLTNLTTLRLCFYSKPSLTGDVPNLPASLLTLEYTFTICYGLSGTVPDLTTGTNLNSLFNTFYSCTNLSGNVDVIFSNTNNLTKLTTSAQCFYNNYKLTGSGMRFVNASKSPSYIELTNSTSSSYRTFLNCTKLNDYALIPDCYGGTNTDIVFTSTGMSNTWTAPFVAGQSVTWVNPSGATTNALTPNITFFTNAGTYRIQSTAWTNVTALNFGTSGNPAYLTSLSQSPNVIAKLTGLITAVNMFSYQSNLVMDITYWNLNSLTNLTSLSSPFFQCKSLTGTIPAISNLIKVSTLQQAFQNCRLLSGSIPDYSMLTNLGNNALDQTFYGCAGLTGTIPAFSNLTKLRGSYGLYFAFNGCTGLTGSIPDYSMLTNMSDMSLYAAFQGCNKLTGSIPNYSTLSNLTSLDSTFLNCQGLTGSISDVTTMTNLTDIAAAFYGCTNLTGVIETIFSNTNNLTKLTTSAQCFRNNYKLTGNGMRFVNAPKSASYVTNGGSLSSSYQTFLNCTNLSDYATIPAWYK